MTLKAITPKMDPKKPLKEDEQKIIDEVRKELPGQEFATKIVTAQLHYRGPYDWHDVARQIGKTLPFRPFLMRGALWTTIETYPGIIPGEALLKYKEADKLGIFDNFIVATPAYDAIDSNDPWLLGRIEHPSRYSHSHFIIAYWD